MANLDALHVELNAQLVDEINRLRAELAAVPKWTRIDNYESSTWPPDDATIVEACQWQPDEGIAGQWWVGLMAGARLIYLSALNVNEPALAYHWRTFTPPPEADDA